MVKVTKEEKKHCRYIVENNDTLDNIGGEWNSYDVFSRLLDDSDRCEELETCSSYCTGMDLQCAELKEANERNKKLEKGLNLILSHLETFVEFKSTTSYDYVIERLRHVTKSILEKDKK